MTSELTCSKCKQPPKFYCERCQEPYCSSECQVSDWREHKSICYKMPNLVPLQMFKSTSNLSMKSEASSRRQYGSKDNLNDTRRTNTSGSKSRNPIECDDSCGGAKPKKILQDEAFTLLPKAVPAAEVETNVSRNTPSKNTGTNFVDKPANWKLPYPPPSGYFDAIIQYVEESEHVGKRFLWITDVKYDAPLRKLLAEIHRNVDQKDPCNPDLIIPGALVAAPLSKILYRAIVLESSPKTQRADVRLIDYGNELRIPFNQIYAPIPIMANLNAYAIRVCIQGDCGALELESVINIKVVGEKHPAGYYNVELKEKTVPLQLPVELLTNEKSLSVVKCFADSRHALLRMNSIGNISLDEILNSEQTLQYEFENAPKEGAFVATRTSKGWKRARLLGLLDKSHEYLVYLIDDGDIVITPQIKRIPTPFLTQPMQVFAVSTSSPEFVFSECLLKAKNVSLQLLPATSVIAGKDSKTHVSCALFEDSRKILDVVIASVFTGSPNELELPFWHEILENGSHVTISNVLTFKEVYIAAIECKEYSKIFMSEQTKCIPFNEKDDIKKGDLVFVHNQQETPYRGQIKEVNTNTFSILDVDKGYDHFNVQRKFLFKPTNIIRTLPVRCSLIKFMYLETIQTPIADNKALEALESCMENYTSFEVSTMGINQAVDLLFRTNERQSLCKKLIPMVFEPRDSSKAKPLQNATIQSAANTALPPTPPTPPITPTSPDAQVKVFTAPPENATANKIYTLEDLKVIPIECGEKVELYVLDATTLVNQDGPYVTAADFNNKAFLRKMESYLAMVGEYCNSSKAPKTGYAPKKMEICLSIFADDNQWYRALCVDHVGDDQFLVLFLDYGNISKVAKKDIMPIIPDLMFPSNANMVYIDGITSKEQAVKLAKVTQTNPIIKAQVSALPESDTYLAKVYNLDKLIGG